MNLFYRVQNFFSQLFWAFEMGCLAFKSNSYDYVPALRIFNSALKRLQKTIENSPHQPDKQKRTIRQMTVLLDRITSDESHHDYLRTNVLEKKYGPSNYIFVDHPSFPSLRTIKNTNPNSELKEYQTLYKKLLYEAQYLETQDIELFSRLFKKHIRTMWD